MSCRLTGSWGPDSALLTLPSSPPLPLHSSSTSSISSLPTALNASFLACPYSSGFLWSSPCSSFHPICPSPATTEAPSYPTKFTQPLLGLQLNPPKGSLSPSIMPRDPSGQHLRGPSHSSYYLLPHSLLLLSHCQLSGSLWLPLRLQNNTPFQDTEFPCAPLHFHGHSLDPSTPTPPHLAIPHFISTFPGEPSRPCLCFQHPVC